jgi:hypothetical protein
MLRIVVVCMFLLASLFVQQSTPFSDVARSQGKKEVLPQAGTAAIEKEITVLERRILLLQKELQDLRTKLQLQSKVTLIPVNHVKPSEVVEIIDAVYKETPEVLVVEALPKLKLVAVRADATTTKDVTLIVRKVDEAAMGPWLEGGGVGILSVDQRVRLIREATEMRRGARDANDFSIAITRVEVRNKSLEIAYRFEYKGANKTVPLFRPRQVLKIRHYSKTKTITKEDRVMVTLDSDFMDRKSKDFEGSITLDASPDIEFVEIEMVSAKSGLIPVERKKGSSGFTVGKKISNISYGRRFRQGNYRVSAVSEGYKSRPPQ